MLTFTPFLCSLLQRIACPEKKFALLFAVNETYTEDRGSTVSFLTFLEVLEVCHPRCVRV